jgi:hypothetical protein
MRCAQNLIDNSLIKNIKLAQAEIYRIDNTVSILAGSVAGGNTVSTILDGA